MGSTRERLHGRLSRTNGGRLSRTSGTNAFHGQMARRLSCTSGTGALYGQGTRMTGANAFHSRVARTPFTDEWYERLLQTNCTHAFRGRDTRTTARMPFIDGHLLWTNGSNAS